MPKEHLTDKSVATLPVRGRQTEYYDTVLRGLLLRVTATGARSFGVRYRFAGQARLSTSATSAGSLLRKLASRRGSTWPTR